MNAVLETHVVVKGVIILDDKILIVKRSDEDEIGAGTWEFPGGKIEYEEEIEPALIREVKEEVELDVTVENILYATSFFTKTTRKVILLTYLCHTFSNKIILSGEHSDYMWATREELQQYLPPHIMADLKKTDVLTSNYSTR